MMIDQAMAEAVRRADGRLACKPGCAECCLGDFGITQADAERLREGLKNFDAAYAASIVARARAFDGGDDTPCPALDPETKHCLLYEWRPNQCRVFGPPVRAASGAIGMCELCYVGASDDEIAAAAVDIDVDTLLEPATSVAETLAAL